MKTKFNNLPDALYVLIWILGLGTLETLPSWGAPSRISSSLVNLGEVHKVYLAQGLASVIQLPYPVTEAKVGNPDAISVQISKTLPSEVTLVLKNMGLQATNLIVRCGSRTFVFDLIPSKKTHQDIVRISGSYGSPEMQAMDAILIDSSESKKPNQKRVSP